MTIAVKVTKSGKNAGKERNDIINVSPMTAKAAAKLPELVNPTKLFDFYEPDVEVFNTFPEWLQNKIKGAVDFPGSKLEVLLEDQPQEERTEEEEEASGGW